MRPEEVVWQVLPEQQEHPEQPEIRVVLELWDFPDLLERPVRLDL